MPPDIQPAHGDVAAVVDGVQGDGEPKVVGIAENRSLDFDDADDIARYRFPPCGGDGG